MSENIPELNIRHGRDVIQHQSKVLETLASNLSESFASAVNLINDLSPNGRLLITGMGQAAWIAQKISSTFASLGVASFFVNPSDAIHGDLGRFTSNDIVIVISNSGETGEIIEIIQPLRVVNCKIISITRTKESTLGKHSDICIELGKIDECWPLNLAPTASSTGMLAIGDALAMVVTWKRGFTKEDFGSLHPGGNIGKSFVKVSDIMRTGDRHCIVTPDKSALETIHLYTKTPGRPGCATIVDEEQRLLGIFTDGDLRRLIDSETEFLSLPVANSMTKNPKHIKQTAYAKDALEVLTQFSIDQLVVTDKDQKVVGLIDIQDILKLYN